MGGVPPSPTHLKALELLADGEWHPYEEILRKLMLTVPPGRAKRYQINSRKTAMYNLWKARGVEFTDEELDQRTKEPTDDDIRKGQRLIAGNVLAKGRIFEIQPRGAKSHNPNKRVRLIDADTMLTVSEAAEILRVNARTLHYWVDLGRIPATRAHRRKTLLRREDVLVYARQIGIDRDAVLTAAQAQAHLGVHKSAFNNWVRRGLIPVVRVTPKMFRYRQADLDEFLAKGMPGSTRLTPDRLRWLHRDRLTGNDE